MATTSFIQCDKNRKALKRSAKAGRAPRLCAGNSVCGATAPRMTTASRLQPCSSAGQTQPKSLTRNDVLTAISTSGVSGCKTFRTSSGADPVGSVAPVECKKSRSRRVGGQAQIPGLATDPTVTAETADWKASLEKSVHQEARCGRC